MTGPWRRLGAFVADHGGAALVRVHATEGSVPRETGAWMVLRPDGAFHGTIGGGRLEWEAIAAAREALAHGRGPARFVRQVLGPDLGQCCGGRVTLLIETFDGRDGADLDALAEQEAPFEVACYLDPDGRVTRRLIPPKDVSGPSASPLSHVGEGWGEGWTSPQKAPTSATGQGSVPPSSATAHPHPDPLPHGRGGRRRGAPSQDGWAERHGELRRPVLLFGAGHVGRALVLALAPLPFAVRWIDPRADVFPAHSPANATPVATDALEAEVAAAPAGALVLVMTHDHALDLAVTAAALARPDLPFVGLIGSATKRARFARRFRALGLPEARIAALACPIGLPGIAGKAPAVIAAATAAQLLQASESLASPR